MGNFSPICTHAYPNSLNQLRTCTKRVSKIRVEASKWLRSILKSNGVMNFHHFSSAHNADFRRNQYLSRLLRLQAKCDMLQKKITKESFHVWNVQVDSFAPFVFASVLGSVSVGFDEFLHSSDERLSKILEASLSFLWSCTRKRRIGQSDTRQHIVHHLS